MLPNLQAELLTLKQEGLYRAFRTVSGNHRPAVAVDGRELLLFCSNNYLGLAGHPRLRQASIDAHLGYGVSAPSSRLISDHTDPHATLESRLAGFFGTASSLVFPSGYSANTGIIPVVVGPGDVIFSDRLNHRSLIDGCRLSRAEVVVYDHVDVDDLSRKLADHPSSGRKLIVTDGVFSMGGDLAPLDRLAELSRTHEAILMVDDAHGTGIFGEGGRGTPEHFGVAADVDIWMTSFSKGLGTFGGAIAGKQELIDLAINRSPGFIYTTALPPSLCASTVAAIDLVDDEPKRRTTLLQSAEHIRTCLAESGFDTGPSRSHIIPVMIGEPKRTVAFADTLLNQGIFTLGIRPPTVPDGTGRLRISLMATHTEAHLEELLNVMQTVRSRLPE